MRVVIDTNILVCVAIADRNPEAVILSVVANLEFEWVVSAEILSEYKELSISFRDRVMKEPTSDLLLTPGNFKFSGGFKDDLNSNSP